MIVAATSGVSAIIDPAGRVRQRTGVFTAASLVADVPLRDPRTVADVLGPWPERAVALLGLLSVLAAVVWRRRGRLAAPAGSDTPAEPSSVVTAPV